MLLQALLQKMGRSTAQEQLHFPEGFGATELGQLLQVHPVSHKPFSVRWARKPWTLKSFLDDSMFSLETVLTNIVHRASFVSDVCSIVHIDP